MITKLLARGIGVARISRKSKKEVEHHRYRLICKYAFVIFINFESFFVCKSTLVMTRILIGVISMSGLTRGLLVVINNIWSG